MEVENGVLKADRRPKTTFKALMLDAIYFEGSWRSFATVFLVTLFPVEDKILGW